MDLLTLLNSLKKGTNVLIVTEDKAFHVELTKRSALRNGTTKSVINTADYYKIKKEGVNIHRGVRMFVDRTSCIEIYLW